MTLSIYKTNGISADIDLNALELVEYMSDEIAKDFKSNLSYFKIANFIHYLMYLNPKTKGADGVIYPSVPAGGEGFNVVIKPEVVDSHLKIEGASICHLAKRKDNMYLKIINYSTINGTTINYIDKDIDPREEEYFNSIAEGLSIIN